MFKADYMETEQFKQSLKDGIYQDRILGLLQHNKYNAIETFTVRELVEQLRSRAMTYQKLAHNHPHAANLIMCWRNMVESDSIIIQRPNDAKVNVHEFAKDKLSQDEAKLMSTLLGGKEIMSLAELYSAMAGFQRIIKELMPDAPKLLSRTDSAIPLSVLEINKMSDRAKKNELDSCDSFSYHYHEEVANADIFSSTINASPGNNIVLSINLSAYSNKEILNDIGNILDVWRKELNIEIQQGGIRPSNNSLRKIINYKYLVLLDAMIASQIYPGAVSDELILSNVYKNLDIDSDSLRKTHKKNALSFSEPRGLKVWSKTLSDLGIYELPVIEALAHNF